MTDRTSSKDPISRFRELDEFLSTLDEAADALHHTAQEVSYYELLDSLELRGTVLARRVLRQMTASGAGIALVLTSETYFSSLVLHPYPYVISLVLFGVSLGLAFVADLVLFRASSIDKWLRDKIDETDDEAIRQIFGIRRQFLKNHGGGFATNISLFCLLSGAAVAIGTIAFSELTFYDRPLPTPGAVYIFPA